MNKYWSATVIGSFLAIALAAPSSADDGPQQSGKKTGSPSVAGGKNVTQRLASFTTGVIVGTPIAIFRKSVECTVSDTKELVGESRNPVFLVPAGIISLPWGVFSGGVEGLYTGVANSWVNSDDKPFSKDAFSLGEMK
jgi:hypothetical protein